MKHKLSNALCVIFALLTLALIWAGAGFSYDALPLKYCVICGILWNIQLFITIFWEEL